MKVEAKHDVWWWAPASPACAPQSKPKTRGGVPVSRSYGESHSGAAKAGYAASETRRGRSGESTLDNARARLLGDRMRRSPCTGGEGTTLPARARGASSRARGGGAHGHGGRRRARTRLCRRHHRPCSPCPDEQVETGLQGSRSIAWQLGRNDDGPGAVICGTSLTVD